MEYKGIGYLRTKLQSKRSNVLKKYKYYELKNITRDFNISTPPDMKNFQSCLGWCAKSVDSLANRISFREFKNDDFKLNEIFNKNNPDILFDSAIVGALISGCDFIYISKDENNYPRLQVIDGGNATGIMDPITGMLTEGYAVLKRNEQTGSPIIEAYFTAEKTEIIDKSQNITQSIQNPAPYPLLVPIVYRPDAVRPFGHSRISRAQMSLVGSALRTIKRSEISAEFFSYPQKYVTGLNEDAEIMDKWKATMSTLLSFTVDDEGNIPKVGQFSQQSMAPHLDQLEMFASLFAGDADLTLDDLGFSKSNPASAEAIKSTHENLRLTAQKAQKTFGSCFLNVGYLAACLRDNITYDRSAFFQTKARWYPIFTPDASQMSGIGDALLKIDQVAPGFLTDDKLEDLLGL